MKIVTLAVTKLFLIGLGSGLVSCGKSEVEATRDQPVPIEIFVAKERPLRLETTLPGRLEAVRISEVRAQVSGIVLKRYFEEGAEVRQGATLFLIDPAPFQAALSQAQGNLAKANAEFEVADSLLARYSLLVTDGAISRQDFDNAKAAWKTAQAQRQVTIAALETAKINLRYTKVKAAIAGRIGPALVTEGALVTQDAPAPMAVIQQFDPIYANFKQPVAESLQWRRGPVNGSSATHQTSVALSISVNETDHQGELLFADISVDAGTGQILLKGRFPNKDASLLPGMYVRIHMKDKQEHPALFVPQRAIRQDGGKTQYLLLVDDNNVVFRRDVETGQMQGGEWQILKGLKAGERIVAGSSSSVAPGTKVMLKNVFGRDGGRSLRPT